MPRRWLTANDLAEYLGVHVGTIRNWTSLRKIPHSKIGGKLVRYDREAIDRWLLEAKVEPIQRIDPREVMTGGTRTQG